MRSSNFTRKLRVCSFGLFLTLCLSIKSQTSYNVTYNALGNSPLHFDWALAMALNDLNNTTTITSEILLDNYPTQNGNGGTTFIKVNYNLQAITLPAGKTLTIKKNANNPHIQGFDMTHYNVMPTCNTPPGFCWTSPLYGLYVINCDPTSTVKIKDVKFLNFNKTFDAYISNIYSNHAPLPSNFSQYWGQCAGGPPCLIIGNAGICSVVTCTFQNYVTGIQYAKVADMTISNNEFITDGHNGFTNTCPFDAVSNSINYNDNTISSTVMKSVIKNNTISSGNLDSYNGAGIIINPFNWLGQQEDNMMSNVNANLDFTIKQNQIRNCTHGLVQFPMQPNRSSPDQSYQMDINENLFSNASVNVLLGGPYRHFKMNLNTFELKNTLPTPIDGNTQPCYLGLGFYTLTTVGNGLLPQRFYTDNSFGFKMIYPNSLGLPLQNNTNIFKFIDNPNFQAEPCIFTAGDFGKELDIIGITNYTGYFDIGSGKNTNIRECLNTLNGREIGNPPPTSNSNVVYINPIAHSNNLVANPITIQNLSFDPSNGNIASPTLKKALVQSGTKLKIAFDLVGNNITLPNGPFVIEFYKSNAKGELVGFIGKQTINTLTNFTYSVTVNSAIPLSVTGERIAATLTSLGTNNNSNAPLGTSTVTYIYAIPCNDCISDFAPIPGKEYVASAWTKRELPANNFASGYSGLGFRVTFYSSTIPLIQIGSVVDFGGPGSFVDGWEKVEGKFTIPANAVSMKLELKNEGPNTLAYFDDIRVFPVDATMKSYAYDPNNMRLMAEMDENNYATFYEYDEEGKLVRVKKETDKGIMTIKESRNNKPTK